MIIFNSSFFQIIVVMWSRNAFAALSVFSCLALLFSCNEVEFNNPALQADLNNELWRATSFSASYDASGSLVISGTNNIETLVLTLPSDELGSQDLGPEEGAKAVFTDGFGTKYSTAVLPDESASVYTDLGVVNLTEKNTAGNTITGDFFFVAYDEEGLESVGLSNGIFFELVINEN
jgi:hypothetical protein